MLKAFACVLLLGSLLLAGPFAGSTEQPTGVAPVSPVLSAPPLTIGPGDLIGVTIFDSPELSGHFRVDEKGDVDVPLLGPVHVQGLTAEQTGNLIEKRYVVAEILRSESSQATVLIEEYTNQRITVGGEVRNPGVYPALGVRTLHDLVTAAGGVTQLAGSNVIITSRSDPEHSVTVEYIPEALHPVIPTVQIFPGDSIVVPRAGIVYVMGNVSRSGGYLLDGRNSLTVEKAMGLAGGSGRGAQLRHVRLVRILQDGRKEMITIPVDRIFKGTSPDVALRDGDILFVPTSTGKLALAQAISAAVSIGTSVAIYKTALQ